MADNTQQNILSQPLNVIALGVELFVEPLARQNVPVALVDWRPPTEDRQEAYALLAYLED